MDKVGLYNSIKQKLQDNLYVYQSGNIDYNGIGSSQSVEGIDEAALAVIHLLEKLTTQV